MWKVKDTKTTMVADLKSRSCTCREWDINRIPSAHASAAILGGNKNVDDYLNKYYHVETYKKVYNLVIMPIPDKHNGLLVNWKS